MKRRHRRTLYVADCVIDNLWWQGRRLAHPTKEGWANGQYAANRFFRTSRKMNGVLSANAEYAHVMRVQWRGGRRTVTTWNWRAK